ncbi:MAG TPA: acetate--CoA ligase family protein [Xanthobacteraceae bacterium]|nr:acetate--CoA ligase family protein [Xanthobacteraceae bacterium]
MPEQAADQAFRSPLPLLNPRSVAIVGASERGKWATQIFHNLRRFGYPGKVYPVNPRVDEVWGSRCYPDLASLPEPADHALVIVPASAVQAVVETGVKAGLKSATIYASQIGEGEDPEIVARGATLKALIERSGLVVCGPNCMGANALREKYFGYPNTELCQLPPGSVGLVTQSGGTLQYLGQVGAQRGVKFSYMISSGNEINLDLADYINFLVADVHTRVITLFIEGIRRPQQFMAAAAKALAVGKPIIAIKTGKSQKSRDSARSHTGAIAGDYAAFAAMCERYGIVICPTLDDMIEMTLAFQNGRLPKGNRVGWVTTSGGTVDLLYDYLDEMGTLATPDFDAAIKARLRPLVSPELALKNPLDAGNPGGEAESAELCRAVAADPNVDILAWGSTLPSGKRARDPALLRSISQSTDKPVIAFVRMNFPVEKPAVEFQDQVGFPYLMGLPQTIRALSALAFYGARRGRHIPRLPPARGDARKLQGAAFEAALADHGLTPPRNGVASSPQEAAKIAASIGFPVALKIVSAAISHKTELGAVRLNLKSPEEVEREAAALATLIHKAAPDASLDGFLVQEMAEGTEIIVGARLDPLFGPLLAVGAGGILVELVQDVACRLLPITPQDARDMLGELKVAKLLEGFRGRPPADVDALTTAMCGLSDFYLEHRHLLADIEINPLIVCAKGEGVRAVDVRMSPLVG